MSKPKLVEILEVELRTGCPSYKVFIAGTEVYHSESAPAAKNIMAICKLAIEFARLEPLPARRISEITEADLVDGAYYVIDKRVHQWEDGAWWTIGWDTPSHFGNIQQGFPDSLIARLEIPKLEHRTP